MVGVPTQTVRNPDRHEVKPLTKQDASTRELLGPELQTIIR